MYILLNNNNVKEIIPDINPIFPDVHIKDRYPKEFIDQLLYIDDNTNVEQNWIYNPETETFSEPPIPEPILKSQLPAIKEPKQKLPTNEERISALEDVMLEMLGVTTNE